jgi:hypothetical protein
MLETDLGVAGRPGDGPRGHDDLPGPIPTAIFAGVPDVGWDDAVWNWMLAGSGNLVGAVVFVATSYWYLFLKERPDRAPTTKPEPAERV